MSTDVPVFKVHAFTSDFEFLIGVNESSKHSNSNFAHSMTFIAFSYQFYKQYQFVKEVSLWCKLLCKLSIYTLKSDEWITIW